MRSTLAFALILAGLVATTACAPTESEAQRRHEANTAAGKLGQAAHKASVEVDKAGRVVSRHLEKAAHDAHEGWNEDARKQHSARQ